MLPGMQKAASRKVDMACFSLLVLLLLKKK